MIITIAASPLNVRRKQQGKKPSGTQGTLGSEAPTKNTKMQEGANAGFLLKQKEGKCYTWHILIDRNISYVKI